MLQVRMWYYEGCDTKPAKGVRYCSRDCYEEDKFKYGLCILDGCNENRVKGTRVCEKHGIKTLDGKTSD